MNQIEWDEPAQPRRMALLVAETATGESRPATVDDLRRACAVAGIALCECADNGERPVDRTTHLETALEQSEAARADLADKLDETRSQLAWARKCVELVQSAVWLDDGCGCRFVSDAMDLVDEMSGG